MDMKMIVVDCLLPSIKQKRNIGHNKKSVDVFFKVKKRHNQ